MHISHRKHEQGVAIALSILALLLLSAIAISMMYMSTTETTVNANFKAEETEYFAARAGVEEVRDRMLPQSPNTINDYQIVSGVDTCLVTSKCQLPTVLPGQGNPWALYILQSGVSMSDVTTFGTNTKCPPSATGASCLVDDEVCHDFPGAAGMSVTSSNVRCTTQPSGSTWYNSTTSASPYALDWKWIRITLKQNNSAPYTVDSGQANTGLACWNGVNEVVTTSTTLPSPNVNNSPCGNLTPMANPVYLITALGVNANGARRVVQMELAQNPVTGQPGGLFATGTGCGNPLNLGGNLSTYGFDSATESGGATNPPSNVNTTGGSIGANGSVSISGSAASINGDISSTYPPSTGSCPLNAVSVSGNPNYNGLTQLTAAYTPPTPAYPNPMPPQTTCTTCTGTLAPGSYGNISLSGSTTLTLQGGTAGNPTVYNINSLTEAGQSSVTVSPVGPVIINIAGQGQSTVLDLSGGGFANNSYIASDLVFNYPGTGAINLKGGAGAYFVLNAPNGSLTLVGNSSFYGQALASTITVQGHPSFYWDQAANTPSTNNTPFYEISLRELSY